MDSKTVDIAAGASVPTTIVAWFADTLPILQWLAAAASVGLFILAAWKHFRK